jgi:ParB-like chromosome segregation protein Spo0J
MKIKQLRLEPVPLANLRDVGGGLVRFRQEVDDDGLPTLMRSICDLGLVTPPVVWKTTASDTDRRSTDVEEPLYVVLDGCRRVDALRKLAQPSEGGHAPPESVQCIIVEGRPDMARDFRAQLQLGGLFRLETNAGDAAVGLSEFLLGWERQVDVARALRISQGYVSTLIKLAASLVPEALEALRSGKIDKDKAAKLAKLVNPDGSPKQEKQRAALEKLLSKPKPRKPRKPRRKTVSRAKPRFIARIAAPAVP